MQSNQGAPSQVGPIKKNTHTLYQLLQFLHNGNNAIITKH